MHVLAMGQLATNTDFGLKAYSYLSTIVLQTSIAKKKKRKKNMVSTAICNRQLKTGFLFEKKRESQKKGF